MADLTIDTSLPAGPDYPLPADAIVPLPTVISVGRRAPRLLDEQHIAAPAGNEAIPAEATGSDREGGA